MFEKLANSTFRIVCGHSSGSGFSYRLENIIITNCHVIENTFITKQEIYAITEDNISFLAKLIAYSSKEEYDFAILEIQSSLPKNRNILQPNLELELKRGIKTVFSGFPHGIPDLLIHEAIISNVQNTKSFYLDGSINGGNSGGPIIDSLSGKVIGIVTQRRFLSPYNYSSAKKNVNDIQKQCESFIDKGGNVYINGLDISRVVGLISQSLSITSNVLDSNANVGIRIGFRIIFVENKLKELGYI